jgi:hypothetical protein
MSYDPLSDIEDQPLAITPGTVQELTDLRQAEKFADLPGYNITEEQERLSAVLNDLLDRLIAGVATNPTKLWVMMQFQPSLEAIEDEDTEGRERFGAYMERIMDILEIESSDGLLDYYL